MFAIGFLSLISVGFAFMSLGGDDDDLSDVEQIDDGHDQDGQEQTSSDLVSDLIDAIPDSDQSYVGDMDSASDEDGASLDDDNEQDFPADETSEVEADRRGHEHIDRADSRQPSHPRGCRAQLAFSCCRPHRVGRCLGRLLPPKFV